jgi:hypothetical protein
LLGPKIGVLFNRPVRQGSVNFVKLTQPGDYAKYCSTAVQVELREGDLLLWDSRTVHCAQGVDVSAGEAAAIIPPPPRGVDTATAATAGGDGDCGGGADIRLLARIVAYITMVPRAHVRSAKGCKKMRETFVAEGMTSGHNPLVTTLGHDPSVTAAGASTPGSSVGGGSGGGSGGGGGCGGGDVACATATIAAPRPGLPPVTDPKWELI